MGFLTVGIATLPSIGLFLSLPGFDAVLRVATTKDQSFVAVAVSGTLATMAFLSMGLWQMLPGGEYKRARKSLVGAAGLFTYGVIMALVLAAHLRMVFGMGLREGRILPWILQQLQDLDVALLAVFTLLATYGGIVMLCVSLAEVAYPYWKRGREELKEIKAELKELPKYIKNYAGKTREKKEQHAQEEVEPRPPVRKLGDPPREQHR